MPTSQGIGIKKLPEMIKNTARSRSGFIIKYAGCPIIWGSRLQTEFTQSSTESEYISLSQSLKEVIPIIALIRELKRHNFNFNDDDPDVKCKAFEDNDGAYQRATVPKLRPQTKHINIKYHHFRDAVECGDITIDKIGTTEQQADIFTKPLSSRAFLYIYNN
jgi:hypothetical protein